LLDSTKFTLDYRIGFYALSPNLRLTLPGFLHYVQDCSLMHTLNTKDGMNFYDFHNLAWVITHWDVAIDRYPSAGEKLRISTWPVRYSGFFGERGFSAMDEQNQIILRANSNWILTNRETLKPVRPTTQMAENFGATYPLPLPRDFSMPPLPDTPPATRQYTVTRRDIDTNEHANNVRYLDWVFEDIPDEITTNKQPNRLKVIYKKECTRGDKIQIAQQIINKPDSIEIVNQITKNNNLACQIITNWV